MKADCSYEGAERRRRSFTVCVGINQIWKSIIPIFPSGPPPFTRKRIDLSHVNNNGMCVGWGGGLLVVVMVNGDGGDGGDGHGREDFETREEDENHHRVLLVAIIMTRIGGIQQNSINISISISINISHSSSRSCSIGKGGYTAYIQRVQGQPNLKPVHAYHLQQIIRARVTACLLAYCSVIINCGSIRTLSSSRRHTPYFGQPDYRLYELNKRLQQRNEIVTSRRAGYRQVVVNRTPCQEGLSPTYTISQCPSDDPSYSITNRCNAIV
ncbi:hypothetical protein HZH68_007730 [Vespula germanica]|uniref:Uncharacterized protein n=1 Tax=Vespula germanica TaxID=30212 RepID=A0A834N9C3_VESGE|nr:hypothetical protein HZH68_007730 [Vespula germanica]